MEVLGFVLWISTFVVYTMFILWAFLPEETLIAFGVSYYPSKCVAGLARRVWPVLAVTRERRRWWAVALPAFVSVLLFLVVVFYVGYNIAKTNPLHSKYTITGGKASGALARLKAVVQTSTRTRQSTAGTVASTLAAGDSAACMKPRGR